MLGRRASQWRELVALLEHLPPESALSQALSGVRVTERWTYTEHLLAAVVDSVRAGNWQRGGGKGPKPKPIRAPGDVDRRPEALESFDVMAPADLRAELAARYKPAADGEGGD